MQLTLDDAAALRARETGRQAVEQHNADFVATMRRVAITLALTRGSVTSDDLRLAAAQHGLKPEHPNAWGAIFRGKGWRVVGHRRSAVESSHAREIKVWAYGSSSAT